MAIVTSEEMRKFEDAVIAHAKAVERERIVQKLEAYLVRLKAADPSNLTTQVECCIMLVRESD